MAGTKLSSYNMAMILLLFFLLSVSSGNPAMQLVGGLGTILIILFFFNIKLKTNHWTPFYLFMALVTLLQWPFYLNGENLIGYTVNTGTMVLMWVLMLVFSFFLSQLLLKLSLQSIEKILLWFFWLNFVVMVFQYIHTAIVKGAVIPYMVSMGTGDFIKGVFANSSVSMIVFSFYTVYFFYSKNIRLAVLAALLMLASTYMSGIFIFLVVISGFAFFFLSFSKKIRILVSLFLGFLIFSIVSPQNIDYVKENLSKKVFSNKNQARKIISFRKTTEHLFSSFDSFVFGAGGGKFSSRTAFLTSGDYVGWYPKNYVYMSEKFEEGHYSLWNSELLKKPYMDGTANQPFSFYNKIFGEYGMLGFIAFLVLYMGKSIETFSSLTFGKTILLLMLSFFLLDYWFEYFTVILFYELFMQLDIKKKSDATI
jgi:hypothetical protein